MTQEKSGIINDNIKKVNTSDKESRSNIKKAGNMAFLKDLLNIRQIVITIITSDNNILSIPTENLLLKYTLIIEKTIPNIDL